MAASSLVHGWFWLEVIGGLFLAVVAGFAAFILHATSFRRSLRKTKSVSEENFTEYLRGYGFDPRVAATTYEYLQGIQDVRFPILPGDTLDWDLGLDDQRIEEAVSALSARLGRQIRAALVYPYPRTVQDLIRMVQDAPLVDQRVAA